jgi:hypothetical protein
LFWMPFSLANLPRVPRRAVSVCADKYIGA